MINQTIKYSLLIIKLASNICFCTAYCPNEHELNVPLIQLNHFRMDDLAIYKFRVFKRKKI